MIAFVFASLLHVAPCTEGATKAPSVCGTYTVYEDRAAKSGRTIAIHFIDIKAKHPSHRVIVFNPGGPGAPATALASGFADSDPPFAKLRDRYDILLVDNRGTGESAPQNCEFAPPSHPELYFKQLWPDSLVKACRDKLAAHADLSLYTTSDAVDDLDDVRAALGYPKMVLFGGSYGTMFYLAYARAHPDHVESVLLEGVAPPHYYIIPLPMAGGAQLAMDGIISACKAEATCAKAFPNFAEHFDTLVHRFDQGPITISVRNAATKKMQSVALSKEVFADRLRQTMYFPNQAAYIPVIVERAFHGDYGPLAQQIDATTQLFDHIQADGLNLSVSCAEDIPFIAESDVAAATAHSFEGDLRVRAQQHACSIWNVRPASASFVDPVKSDASILMINGSNDPASPLQYGQAALANLPNAREMVIKGGTHDSDLPPCADKASVAFILAGSAKGMDLDHCGATYKLPPFATLALDESAPGENQKRSARFRALLVDLVRGHVDRGQMTPALSKQISDALAKDISSAGLGKMNAFIYKGSSTSTDGTTYRYLAKFDGGNASVTYKLDKSDRFSGFDVTPL